MKKMLLTSAALVLVAFPVGSKATSTKRPMPELGDLERLVAESETLELVSKVTFQTQDGNEVTTTSTDKLTLSADGKSLTVVRHSESPRGPQDSTLVFNK